ncbi:MAG: DUF1800 domain-containing protein [Blastocatellia bacterium]|nr:MAG: DUF1800 domain-containing protein [Blastocatellia bacterium]
MKKVYRWRLAGLALVWSVASFSVFTAASRLDDDQMIVHVLNRIGFGPRPGDVTKVRALGIQRYIEGQLHPEQVPDPGMNAHLEGLTTLGMSAQQIAERFEIPELQARRARRQQSADGPDASRPQATPEMRQGNQLIVELSQQKLLRAIYSERQLQEVLTDFWFNHFNVDARKGRDRFMLTAYERDVIRPHVLGKFRDLLEATAKSPAMLFYLDNWLSADPNGPHGDGLNVSRPRFGPGPFVGRPVFPRAQRPGDSARNLNDPNGGRGVGIKQGLNENYARELMELHTLGADGGFTQTDVTEVSRSFTGWTLSNPRLGGGYRFEPRIHDDGEKLVLGHHIKAGGGESDGEQVLEILSRHPSTARFVTTKLVRRFVSDTPPPALVDRAAARFRETDGDLREVMRTILTSPEFFAREAQRAKVKTPFEFVVSAIRATAADVRDATPLVRVMQQLGMPLYASQPPTGYPDTADAWVNAGAIVNRMNFALSLASDEIRGVAIDRAGLIGNESSPKLDRVVTHLVEAILSNEVTETTRTAIARAESVPQMAALALGSPEFQRR